MWRFSCVAQGQLLKQTASFRRFCLLEQNRLTGKLSFCINLDKTSHLSFPFSAFFSLSCILAATWQDFEISFQFSIYFFSLCILLHFCPSKQAQNKSQLLVCLQGIPVSHQGDALVLHFSKLSRTRDGQNTCTHTHKQFSYIFNMCTYFHMFSILAVVQKSVKSYLLGLLPVLCHYIALGIRE